MATKTLLIVTAIAEVGAGIALIGVPSWSAEVLLGVGLTSPPALVVARVAGFALMSLAIACWLLRNADRRGQSGLVAGMLLYNIAVPIVLVVARFVDSLEGLAIWPACLLHAALAIWCIVVLRPNRLN